MSLFGTAGIRGPVATAVTPSLALAVGRAVGRSIVEDSDRPGAGGATETVVLGYDGRETSQTLASAAAAGLSSAGVAVRRIGRVPTPTLAYASRGRHGVMITASHNPPADNGIKLFVDGVEYDRDAEREIETAVETSDVADWAKWGTIERADRLDRYREAVCDYVRGRFHGSDGGSRARERSNGEPLGDLSIVVDCGTGVGGEVTPHVLDRLGADVTALNANVDGHFPARESKPTPETLTDLSAFLARGDHDLGLAQDGDADRLVALGPDGEVVHEDTVLAVVAAHYVRSAAADDPVVVTTPNASARIDELVREAGGRVERVRLGALHEGIARVRADADSGADTAVVFAAEPWKHIHPAFGGWIDGVASAAMVAGLVADAGDVETLREPVSERPYRKVSVPCPDESKAAAMADLETSLPDRFPEGTVDTAYGVRVEFPDASWVLVRPSGTEPYVRLYAESDDVEALVGETEAAIEAAIESA